MHDPVGFNVCKLTHNAAWPSHDKPINPCMAPQAKMEPLMILGDAVHPSCLLTDLYDTACFQFNF